MEKILKSKVGKFITISNANLVRGRRKIVPVLGVNFRVDFCHYEYKRASIIYCNNVSMGVYWYLFDLLSLSKRCNVGINKAEILALIKECRLSF